MIGRAAKLALLICLGSLAGSAWGQQPGARFIPLQMIVGDRWNGEQSITYPSGRFTEGVTQGAASVWNGPKQWTHPKTGRTLTVYFRARDGRNAADQVFAVRDDLSAIGRVADSRFGITACDQEGKYPLGLWQQGETRTFDYPCWYGDKIRPKVNTITIQEIDFTYDGVEHCLKHEWIHRDKGSDGRPIDRRVYIFCPDRGMVREWQVP